MEHVEDSIEVLEKTDSSLELGGRNIVQVQIAKAINIEIGQKIGAPDGFGQLSNRDIRVPAHKPYYEMDILMNHHQGDGLSVIRSSGIFFETLSTPHPRMVPQRRPPGSKRFGLGG